MSWRDANGRQVTLEDLRHWEQTERLSHYHEQRAEAARLRDALRNLLAAIDKHQIARTGYGFEYEAAKAAIEGQHDRPELVELPEREVRS